MPLCQQISTLPRDTATTALLTKTLPAGNCSCSVAMVIRCGYHLLFSPSLSILHSFCSVGRLQCSCDGVKDAGIPPHEAPMSGTIWSQGHSDQCVCASCIRPTSLSAEPAQSCKSVIAELKGRSVKSLSSHLCIVLTKGICCVWRAIIQGAVNHSRISVLLSQHGGSRCINYCYYYLHMPLLLCLYIALIWPLRCRLCHCALFWLCWRRQTQEGVYLQAEIAGSCCTCTHTHRHAHTNAHCCTHFCHLNLDVKYAQRCETQTPAGLWRTHQSRNAFTLDFSSF